MAEPTGQTGETGEQIPDWAGWEQRSMTGFLVTYGPDEPTMTCMDCQRSKRLSAPSGGELRPADFERHQAAHVHGHQGGW